MIILGVPVSSLNVCPFSVILVIHWTARLTSNQHLVNPFQYLSNKQMLVTELVTAFCCWETHVSIFRIVVDMSL